MESFKKIFGNEMQKKIISELSELQKEFSFVVSNNFGGATEIRVKIYKNEDGTFGYANNKKFKNSSKEGVYNPSRNIFPTFNEALNAAKNEIFNVFDPDDRNGTWEPNPSY